MKKKKTAIYVFVILLLAVNLIMTSVLLSKPVGQYTTRPKSLPCESVPISWAVNNYQCANSLLRAMNVTNVKFNPPETANAPKLSQGSVHVQVCIDRWKAGLINLSETVKCVDMYASQSQRDLNKG